METKTFGQRLFKLRKDYNLTQSLLAEILFVSPKTISKWEKDRGMPSIDILISLAKFFKVSTDYLLIGETIEDPTKISFVEWNSGKFKSFKMPDLSVFPDGTRCFLFSYFLREYAKENNVNEDVFMDKVMEITKPKDINEGIEQLLNLEQVSTLKIQRTLSVGFTRGARIKSLLIYEGYLVSGSEGRCVWKNKEGNEEVIKKLILSV